MQHSSHVPPNLETARSAYAFPNILLKFSSKMEIKVEDWLVALFLVCITVAMTASFLRPVVVHPRDHGGGRK